MRRSEIQEPKSSPHFIGAWTAQPISICDEITCFFEKNLGKQTIGLSMVGLDKSIKSRTDISIPPSDICLPGYAAFQDYFEILHCCYKDYLDQWPFFQRFAHTLDVGTFNVGRYQQGQHFNGIHCERMSYKLHRVFAFLTYLNDVVSGGSTYFSHYDLEIQPQKGLTLIWPAGFTHAHSGNIIERGIEYMITGWLHLVANHKKSK